MQTYTVTLQFTNLDNSLYTDDQARMNIKIESDSYSHAYLLAQRFARVMDADAFFIED